MKFFSACLSAVLFTANLASANIRRSRKLKENPSNAQPIPDQCIVIFKDTTMTSDKILSFGENLKCDEKEEDKGNQIKLEYGKTIKAVTIENVSDCQLLLLEQDPDVVSIQQVRSPSNMFIAGFQSLSPLSSSYFFRIWHSSTLLVKLLTTRWTLRRRRMFRRGDWIASTKSQMISMASTTTGTPELAFRCTSLTPESV
jgi:hypothetical protein